MNRRGFTGATLTAIPLGLAGTLTAGAASPSQISTAVNGKGWPFASPPAVGIPASYVMEEFLIEGDAHRYVGVGADAFPTSGLWRTEIGARAPFKTRAYVVRPRSVEDSNGVVVVNWQNVTAGFDLGAPLNPEIFRGYAWVGLTTQKIGVDGMPGTTPGLRQWDPQRYGSLTHPGDAWSYDIFTQLGRHLKSDDALRRALLGDLVAETVIATGGSQSAMRLASYINAAHVHEGVYDGFHLTVHWGICPPVEEVELMATFAAQGATLSPYHCQIRDDLGVPIHVIATECEARYNYPVRQPDTDTFRFWEVAGASHQSPRRGDGLRAIMARDGLDLGVTMEDRNAVHWDYIDDAALRAVVTWARQGKPPASVERIRMDGNQPESLQRDAHGNVLGGIRVPELEAPIASYRGERGDLEDPGWLQGQTTPFDPAKVAALHPHGRAAQWLDAVDRLVKAGLVLPEDEAILRARGV